MSFDDQIESLLEEGLTEEQAILAIETAYDHNTDLLESEEL